MERLGVEVKQYRLVLGDNILDFYRVDKNQYFMLLSQIQKTTSASLDDLRKFFDDGGKQEVGQSFIVKAEQMELGSKGFSNKGFIEVVPLEAAISFWIAAMVGGDEKPFDIVIDCVWDFITLALEVQHKEREKKNEN